MTDIDTGLTLYLTGLLITHLSKAGKNNTPQAKHDHLSPQRPRRYLINTPARSKTKRSMIQRHP